MGSTTTRRPSRFRRYADGGRTSAVFAIRSRAAVVSPPMAADRTDRVCDWGNLNCSASPMNSQYQLKSIICRPEPANGTRLVPAKAGIEHRLFSFISQNWRAKPLLSYRVIVELIGATTTRTGLTVRCELDDKPYPKGIVVSDEVMRNLTFSTRISRRMELHNCPSNPCAPAGGQDQAAVLTVCGAC